MHGIETPMGSFPSTDAVRCSVSYSMLSACNRSVGYSGTLSVEQSDRERCKRLWPSKMEPLDIVHPTLFKELKEVGVLHVLCHDLKAK